MEKIHNKVIAVGDIHGRTIWKDIVTKELDSSNKFVFIGDYFDSKEDISSEDQIINFLEILELKRNNPDKVILLIGNHCFHYMGFVNEEYSGYQYGVANRINKILKQALDEGLLQMCYKHDVYVFTHAGVTKTWADNSGVDINDLENSINTLFITNPRYFRFTVGDNYSRSGNDITQPPIWVRPESLLADAINDVIYIVGHTTVKKLGLTENLPNLILIDCLGTTGEYLVIENDLVKAKSLK
jgi:hypothetical protein